MLAHFWPEGLPSVGIEFESDEKDLLIADKIIGYDSCLKDSGIFYQNGVH